MIEVIYNGYIKEMVEDHLLAGLIDANKIIAFRRESGWVVIGKDPIRVKNIEPPGDEQRKVDPPGL